MSLREIRADRSMLSRVGAVFSGISAEMQPFHPRFFNRSMTALHLQYVFIPKPVAAFGRHA